MRKLFSLFVALFATISLWSYDFQSGDLCYKFGNAEGVESIVGDGSFEKPYTANDVVLLNNQNAGKYWVKACIVGQIAGLPMTDNVEFAAPFSGSTNDDGSVNNYNTNLLIASFSCVTDVAKCVPVQLPSGLLRNGLNLVTNPDMDGQEVLIYGSLEAYFGVPGIKSPEYAKVGDKEFGVNPNVEQKEPTAKVVTIAEFNAAPEAADVYYELTGVISGLDANANASIYGNFDLTDETASVYVYGLTTEFIGIGSISNDKSFASLGLKNGDKITIRGFRGSFNDKIEVMGAYFVEWISSGNETPNPDGNNEITIPEGAIVFDADADQGNAGTDYNNATAYTITKNGVTITVSSGLLGTYYNEKHYRIFKNQTLTITSTAGNIKEIVFTCTANNDEKYGPGCFTVDSGEYVYSGANGQWKGDASTVVFTASANQVRVTQIAVVVDNESKNTTKQNIIFNEPQEHYVIVTNQTNDATNYNTLNEVEIPETVEYNGITYIVSGIDHYAFAYAENLQSITIPKNIKAIGNYAFADCDNLQTITFTSKEPPHIFYDSFTYMHYDVQVYVPCGAVSAYQFAGIDYAQELPAEYDINIPNIVGSGGFARVDYNTICGTQISAEPYIGYQFVQWSDGNTDNPRILELTQDTVLTAEFAQIISGQCGDNLYWSYDKSNQSISITGSGDMYKYTSERQPCWVHFKEEIKMVTTSNSVTSIGSYAFSDCSALTSITIPNSVTTIGQYAFANCEKLGTLVLGDKIKEIGDYAFKECNKLYHIYCYAPEPPVIEENVFTNYNVNLYVPCNYLDSYKYDRVFGSFRYIQCIDSEDVTTDDVVVTPGSNDVTITWPTEDNADNYAIVIEKDGEVFCTLTFNADGQLLNIAFAPSRDGNNRPAQYAEQAVNGYRFTVTGLTEATRYAYNITTKDTAKQTIATYSGEFTTLGGTVTSVEDILQSTTNPKKLLIDGQLYIVKDGKTYNAMGQKM